MSERIRDFPIQSRENAESQVSPEEAFLTLRGDFEKSYAGAVPGLNEGAIRLEVLRFARDRVAAGKELLNLIGRERIEKENPPLYRFMPNLVKPELERIEGLLGLAETYIAEKERAELEESVAKSRVEIEEEKDQEQQKKAA